MKSKMSREFILGAGVVTLAYLMRKPLKKAAVILAGGLLNLGERGREAFYNLKEEVEDIVAEAGYEHVKDKAPLEENEGEDNNGV